MRTMTLSVALSALLAACGTDGSGISDLGSDSDVEALAGEPGPNLDAPVGDVIHSDEYAFACEPNVLQLSNLVTTLSLHTSIKLSLVDRETVIVFGNGETAVDPVLVRSDAIGNMIVRLAAVEIAPYVAAPQTTLTIEGLHVDGTPFAVDGILQAMD